MQIAPTPSGAFADSGRVELLAIDNNGKLPALERSFSIGAVAPDRGYSGKLYLVEVDGATNVIDQPSILDDQNQLTPAAGEFAQKGFLLDLSSLGIVIDNIEGLVPSVRFLTTAVSC